MKPSLSVRLSLSEVLILLITLMSSLVQAEFKLEPIDHQSIRNSVFPCLYGQINENAAKSFITKEPMIDGKKSYGICSRNNKSPIAFAVIDTGKKGERMVQRTNRDRKQDLGYRIDRPESKRFRFRIERYPDCIRRQEQGGKSRIRNVHAQALLLSGWTIVQYRAQHLEVRDFSQTLCRQNRPT